MKGTVMINRLPAIPGLDQDGQPLPQPGLPHRFHGGWHRVQNRDHRDVLYPWTRIWGITDRARGVGRFYCMIPDDDSTTEALVVCYKDGETIYDPCWVLHVSQPTYITAAQMALLAYEEMESVAGLESTDHGDQLVATIEGVGETFRVYSDGENSYFTREVAGVETRTVWRGTATEALRMIALGIEADL